MPTSPASVDDVITNIVFVGSVSAEDVNRYSNDLIQKISDINFMVGKCSGCRSYDKKITYGFRCMVQQSFMNFYICKECYDNRAVGDLSKLSVAACGRP